MSIGGYFELELNQGEEYHKGAYRLNTGRNAFEYILRAKKYKKVYLPYYTCHTMHEPIAKLDLDVDFYAIDSSFWPVFDFKNIKKDQVFVYTNYFGICEKNVSRLNSLCNNLIIDNAQAFYSKPISGVDTFYSPRKFFGVPDGAYLYTDNYFTINIDKDISYKRIEHLLGRIDTKAEDHYSIFRVNEESMSNQPIKTMSNLTEKMLRGIDYDRIKKERLKNFRFLHKELGNANELNIDSFSWTVPMVYPLLVKNGNALKQKLITNKIYIATYWVNVLKVCQEDTLEHQLVRNLLTLPIDQRYNITDMKLIVKLLKNYV